MYYVRSVVLALDLKLHRELHAVITELTQYQTERKDGPQTTMRTSRLSLRLYFAIKKLVVALNPIPNLIYIYALKCIVTRIMVCSLHLYGMHYI